MNTVRTITGFSFIVAALAAIVDGNWQAVGIIVAAAVLLFAPWFINKYVWVRVPAMNTALVYNVETKAFSRFLLPGRHWIRPLEQVKKFAPIAPSFVSGECVQAQTDGGVTAAVKWSVTYCLNPATITAELRPNVANMLLKRIDSLLHTHVNNCITYLFDQQTVETIRATGARQQLERKLRDLVVARLSPFGIQVYRTMLTSIDLPPDVVAAVEAAHQEEIRAHSEARTLERLQLAVSQFSDSDMERLLQLRQLQEMGQHGVSLHVPYSFIDGDARPAAGRWQTGQYRKANGRFHEPPTSERPDFWDRAGSQ